MKTFAYTLRDSDGALKKGSLNAADRADALKKISAMGCIPIAVSEGKADSRSYLAFTIRSKKFLFTVGLISALLTFFLFLSFFRTHPKPKSPPPVKLVEAKSHQEKPTAQLAPIVVESAPVNQTSLIQVAERALPTTKQPAMVMSSISLDKEKDSISNNKSVEPDYSQKPKPVNPFKSSTEQLLAMAMSVPPGKEIPPLPIPKDLDSDFVNSLDNTIVIDDNDDDRSVAIKESVAIAKNKMLELIKEGRSVSEVLKEYEQQTNERSAIHRQAQFELNNIYHTESPQRAKAFMDEVNKSLIELGIDPITLPRQ